ncbi:MAG: 2'-5' RNA ligase family protein [Cyclobacteriaceae bacterium]
MHQACKFKVAVKISIPQLIDNKCESNPDYKKRYNKQIGMHQEKLYFIGVCPPPDISMEIEMLKQEMKLQFGPKHALKSPPHITLQMPFKRAGSFEFVIKDKLNSFASDHEPFKLQLDGFDRFSDRVIFIKVKNSEPLASLYRELQSLLLHDLAFEKQELNARFHPHITIATRDLSKLTFKQAWPAFMNRKFNASFLADRLVLFKHAGKHWEVLEEYKLLGLTK